MPILGNVPDRLPPPGPSYLRERDVRVRDRVLRAGMARPSTGPDGWWLGVAWLQDADGVVSFRDLASAAGPPPDPPLVRLGPAFAGELAGMIREEDGRLAIRLGPIAPPDDPSRPWLAPAAIRIALGLEPARAAAMRPNEIAEQILTAFARSLERIARR